MTCSFVAYVDEAGDEGFDKIGQGTPEWFVLSALITRKHMDIQAVKTIDDVRTLLAKPAKMPLHFRKIKHHQRLPFIARLIQGPVRTITIVVHKPSIQEPENFNEKNRLYHYTLRLLLERLSWFCRDHRRYESPFGDGSVEVVLSNRGGMSLPAIKAYIDKLLASAALTISGVKVFDIRLEPNVIKSSQVYTYSHGKRMGLQLADAVASSHLNALEPLLGFTEDRYVKMLKPIVYQRNGSYLGYGLKFFPREVHGLFKTDARLKWVDDEYK